jgi:hypothetical protein
MMGLYEFVWGLGRVDKEKAKNLREHLTIVGLVGSIDNDMSSTGMSIHYHPPNLFIY